MGSILLPALAALLLMSAVMTAAWAYGRRRRNGGWTDVFWTWGSGAALALAALLTPGDTGRGLLVAGLVVLWSLRLGAYLTPRVAGREDEDPRYARFRQEWGAAYPRRMLQFALSQAVATALLALSVAAAAGRPGPLGLRDGLAVVVFLAALAGEAVADAQMRRFRADPANRGMVMDRGLWAWSRHPNYVFEWAVWLAYPVIALDPGRPASWLTLIAPAVMYLLLTRVSGVPPLEEAMLRSRGEAYRDYQRRVPVFFPTFRRSA